MKKQKRPFEVVTVRRRGVKAAGGLFEGVSGFAEAVAAEQRTHIPETSTDSMSGEAQAGFGTSANGPASKMRVLEDKTQAAPMLLDDPAPKRGRPRKERSEEDEALQAAEAKHRLRKRRVEARGPLETNEGASAGEDGDAPTSLQSALADKDCVRSGEESSILIALGDARARKRERAERRLGERWERHLPRWGKRQKKSGR